MPEHELRSAETDLVSQIGGFLRGKAANDPELRSLLRAVGLWLTALGDERHDRPAVVTEATATASAPPAEPAIVEPVCAVVPLDLMEPKAASPAEQTPAVSDADLQQLMARFSGMGPSPRTAGTPRLATTFEAAGEGPRRTVDLSEISTLAKRMELRADACVFGIHRGEALQRGAGFEAVKPEYDLLKQRIGGLQPCFLWMLDQSSATIAKEDWLILEGCYRATAEVLQCIAAYPARYEQEPDLLKLLGECQSAIRAAMTACNAFPRWTDLDQHAVFEWCRAEGQTRQVFNPFLALTNLANPNLHGGRLARIRKLRQELDATVANDRAIRRGLNTVKYHRDQLSEGCENVEHQWRRIGEGIEAVLAAGMQPSSPDLVELLVPIADDLPEYVYSREGTRRVLRYVDERVAVLEREETSEPTQVREDSKELMLVREALRGTTMVLVGGEERRHSKELIEQEFELSELRWLTSREHGSLAPFLPSIHDDATKVVAIMIRWCGHSSEDLQEAAEAAGKIFVRLPRGYNPTQIAHEIMRQASERLEIPG